MLMSNYQLAQELISRFKPVNGHEMRVEVQIGVMQAAALLAVADALMAADETASPLSKTVSDVGTPVQDT